MPEVLFVRLRVISWIDYLPTADDPLKSHEKSRTTKNCFLSYMELSNTPCLLGLFLRQCFSLTFEPVTGGFIDDATREKASMLVGHCSVEPRTFRSLRTNKIRRHT